MNDEKIELSLFERHVLDCIKEQRLSVEKVQAVYGAHHPRDSWKKHFTSPVSKSAVTHALWVLEVTHKLLKSELVRWYEGESLEEDIRIYSITEKGRSFLLPKGSKK